jgi:hypothetical protein
VVLWRAPDLSTRADATCHTVTPYANPPLIRPPRLCPPCPDSCVLGVSGTCQHSVVSSTPADRFQAQVSPNLAELKHAPGPKSGADSEHHQRVVPPHPGHQFGHEANG